MELSLLVKTIDSVLYYLSNASIHSLGKHELSAHNNGDQDPNDA